MARFADGVCFFLRGQFAGECEIGAFADPDRADVVDVQARAGGRMPQFAGPAPVRERERKVVLHRERVQVESERRVIFSGQSFRDEIGMDVRTAGHDQDASGHADCRQAGDRCAG